MATADCSETDGVSIRPTSVQVAGAELSGSTAEGFSCIPHDSLGVGWCLPSSWQLQARLIWIRILWGARTRGLYLLNRLMAVLRPPQKQKQKHLDPLSVGKKSGTWCCGMPQDLGMFVQGNRPPWEWIQLSQWFLVLPHPVQSTVPWVSHNWLVWSHLCLISGFWRLYKPTGSISQEMTLPTG